MWCSAIRCLVTFILSLLVAPLAAQAQPAGKNTAHRLSSHRALLTGGPGKELEAFRQGLRDRGYVEDQTIALDIRWDEHQPERWPDLAAELVRLRVDLIVAGTVPPTRAAQHATSTIPIVMAISADPVGDGLVASLARPGGNITGLSGLNPELTGKRLELLTAAVPGLTRVALLLDARHLRRDIQRHEPRGCGPRAGGAPAAPGGARAGGVCGCLSGRPRGAGSGADHAGEPPVRWTPGPPRGAGAGEPSADNGRRCRVCHSGGLMDDGPPCSRTGTAPPPTCTRSCTAPNRRTCPWSSPRIQAGP